MQSVANGDHHGSARRSIGSNAISPLHGDQNGNFRVLVVGNSGTGKSTMAGNLGRILSIPAIHLDEIHWQPNWTEKPDDQFRETVASIIRQNDNWIIDGNYSRVVGDLTTSNATSIVWLDPPFALYFPRLILRTFFRLLRLNSPCSPGCDETLSDVFTWGKKSILWWAWTRHDPTRVFFAGEMKKAQEGDSPSGRKWIRIGGWGSTSEVRTWLDRIKEIESRS